MCRIIVILQNQANQKYIIDYFLTQSHEKKNTPGSNNNRDFDYHKDGYGFIFYNDNISFYKSSQMYKDDTNFKFIKDKIIKSNILIGHIRATKYHFKDDVCYNNTHPFWYKNQFWSHNGSVNPFNSNFYNTYIDNKYKSHIKGKTDSEVLFYIYMTIFDKLNDEEKSWIEFIQLLDMFYSKYQITISANIVFSNEKVIIISRYINNNEEPPSLYIDTNTRIISSEPVTDTFELINRNTTIIYNVKDTTIRYIV
jgi:predicted glutamine amidotransferase